MENPFDKDFEGNFSQKVRKCFENKKSGDVFYIDLGKKNVFSARATINNMMDHIKYKTKHSKDDNVLWIKIV